MTAEGEEPVAAVERPTEEDWDGKDQELRE